MGRKKKDHEISNRDLVAFVRLNSTFSSPAYQWYVDQFLGSNRVEMMELAAVGAYKILLDRAWKEPDCGLPDNDEYLARLCRAGAEWERLRGQVRPMFFQLKERIYSRKLLLVRRDAILYRNQRLNALIRANEKKNAASAPAPGEPPA